MSPYIASTDQHRHSSWSLWVFTSFGQNSRGWGWLISKSTNQWISTQSVFLNIGPVFFCWFASCQIHIYKWKYTNTNTNTQSITLNMGPVFFCRSASCQINWQLDILAILGHWGGRKQDEFEEKKNHHHSWGYFSIHVELCFFNWWCRRKVFYNYFHFHPNYSNFLFPWNTKTVPRENNLYHWNLSQCYIRSYIRRSWIELLPIIRHQHRC